MTYTFEGTSVEYIYTKAPNRGIAKITIDGQPVAEIDQYAPTIQWRQSWRITTIQPHVAHVIAITATGRHALAATDSFIDIDNLLRVP